MSPRIQKMFKRGAWCFAGLCVLSLVVFVLSWCIIDPKLECAEKYPGGVVLRDKAGRVLRVALGDGDADCRPYYTASTNDWVVKALVASEDRRFFDHWGVNVPSVLRACFQNATSMRRISGASTITMQASRLIAPHPRNLFWKYIEAFRAMQMELKHDKLWIVSQYLNRAPFGSNLVGVEAAANGWFGKSVQELGIGEAALLAGMVQRPSFFRPDRNLDRALKRRKYVLGRMLALGMIDERQWEGAITAKPEIRRGPRPFEEPFFCDWVMRQIGRGGVESGDFTTTLDADVQEKAKHVVSAAARGGYSASAVVVKVETGEVLALACSDDYFSSDAGQVNVAITPRPAGSTLKPFLTAFAMDRGFVTPDEQLSDVPRAYKGYNPQNFTAMHRGTVTTSEALVLSLNLPFVQLLQRVGVDDFGTLLRLLGCMNITEGNETYGLGMAIGNVQVSLLELAGAYACIARGGKWRNLKFALDTEKIKFPNSEFRIFSGGACWLVSDILSGDERSSAALGHIADVKTSRFAWKTGTSAAFRDAWTVAWNPEYVIGVWCGHKSGNFGDSSLVGAEAAAPFAWELARSLYPGNNGPWYGTAPDDVITRSVCAKSGLPAAPECPETKEGRALRGRSSAALCSMHRRGLDGEIITQGDAFIESFRGTVKKAQRIAIQKPEDGSEFRIVQGLVNQKIVCNAVGNVEDGRLWWFVDGRNIGETRGDSPFVFTPEVGVHRISCSTADGIADSVSITVTEPNYDIISDAKPMAENADKIENLRKVHSENVKK